MALDRRDVRETIWSAGFNYRHVRLTHMPSGISVEYDERPIFELSDVVKLKRAALERLEALVVNAGVSHGT